LLEIIRKDIMLMLRERTFASIVFLLIFIASISSVITFGLLMLYNPDYLGYAGNVKLAVVGDCSIPGDCVDANTAMSMFRERKVDAVLFVTKVGDTTYIDVLLPDDDITAIQVLTSLKRDLVEYEKKVREELGVPNLDLKVFADGFEIKVPSGSSTIFKFIYLILIPLLAITTAVVAAGLTIDSVCEEIQTKALEVLLSTPLTPFRISMAKILTPFIFSSSLTTIWLSLLFINGIEIVRPVETVVISASISALFVAIAYLTAAYFKDRERVQLLFSIFAAGLLPLLMTKAKSPAVMVGRAAAGAGFDVFLAAVFVVTSVSLLVISPVLVKIGRS